MRTEAETSRILWPAPSRIGKVGGALIVGKLWPTRLRRPYLLIATARWSFRIDAPRLPFLLAYRWRQARRTVVYYYSRRDAPDVELAQMVPLWLCIAWTLVPGWCERTGHAWPFDPLRGY